MSGYARLTDLDDCVIRRRVDVAEAISVVDGRCGSVGRRWRIEQLAREGYQVAWWIDHLLRNVMQSERCVDGCRHVGIQFSVKADAVTTAAALRPPVENVKFAAAWQGLFDPDLHLEFRIHGHVDGLAHSDHIRRWSGADDDHPVESRMTEDVTAETHVHVACLPDGRVDGHWRADLIELVLHGTRGVAVSAMDHLSPQTERRVVERITFKPRPFQFCHEIRAIIHQLGRYLDVDVGPTSHQVGRVQQQMIVFIFSPKL